jgi:outer membrane protein assembly factor BamB
MTGGEPVWSRTIRPVDNLAVLNETVVARTNEGVVGLGLSSGETTTEFGLNLSEDDTTFPADGGLGYRRDTLSDTAGSGGSELGVRDIGGSVRWENRVEAGFGSRHYRDPIASPAEGIVAVGDFCYGKRTSPRPDREHFLRAYDLADGTEQWSIEGIIRPRSVGNGRVIAERYEAGSSSLSKSETLALDTGSGDVLWSRTDLPDSGGFTEDPVATADSGDLIYFSGSNQLYALEPEDGSTRWTYDAFPDSNGGGAANIAAATEAAVVSTVAGIVVLSPTDGSRRASNSLSSFAGFVAVAGQRVYAAGPDLALTVLGEG